jgi:hypothetical protein
VNGSPPRNLARTLISINGVFWLVFALIVAAGAHPSYPSGSVYGLGLALSAMGGAAVLFVLARCFESRRL